MLAGKQEGKRQVRRRRRNRVDNIKMDVKDTEWGGMDWIGLEQDRGIRGGLL
jgi:hypothetical protein